MEAARFAGCFASDDVALDASLAGAVPVAGA